MGKKKELLFDAPWRGGEDDNKFDDAKLKVTNNPGSTPTMQVPKKKSTSSAAAADDEEDLESEIDPELRYSFQRNAKFIRRVFSVDTLVKPLPPTMAYNAERSLNFFFRIFTQLSNPEGIADAQKAIGLGNEEKVRRVR